VDELPARAQAERRSLFVVAIVSVMRRLWPVRMASGGRVL